MQTIILFLLLVLLVSDQFGQSRRQHQNQNRQIVFNTDLTLSDPIWNECTEPDPSTYILRPDQVTITPEIPAIGHDIEISIKGNATKTVEKGTVKINIALGLIKFKHELDLCDSLRSVDSSVQCPIKAGPNNIVIKAHIPDNVPPLPIKANVLVYTDSGEVLTCFNVNFRLNPK